MKEGHDGPVEFEVAMQWNDTYTETIYTYVNNIATRQGGTHLTGFSTALTRVLNNYMKGHTSSRTEKMTVTGEDMREGLDRGHLLQSAESPIRRADETETRQQRSGGDRPDRSSAKN